MTWSKGFLNFRKVVCLGQSLKTKGFRSRSRFGQVNGSLLRIQRTKGCTHIFMGLFIFTFSKSLNIYISSNNRLLIFIGQDQYGVYLI